MSLARLKMGVMAFFDRCLEPCNRLARAEKIEDRAGETGIQSNCIDVEQLIVEGRHQIGDANRIGRRLSTIVR